MMSVDCQDPVRSDSLGLIFSFIKDLLVYFRNVQHIILICNKMTTLKQVPLTCGGHTRPVVHLDFSDITKDGYYLISACKGKFW